MLRPFAATTVLAGFFVVAASADLRAQQAPASAPATAPAATQPADSTTPKGTLTLLSRATQRGDTAAVRALLNVTNPAEQKLADMLMQRTAAYATFRKAALKSLGETVANQLTGDSAADAAMAEEHIQKADLTIDNDKATVQMDGQPVKLVKVEGVWKLSLAPLTADMPPGDIDQKLDEVKVLSEVVTQTAQELEQGKFKSADEVNDAIRTKLTAAMLKNIRPPATGPATAPAGAQ